MKLADKIRIIHLAGENSRYYYKESADSRQAKLSALILKLHKLWLLIFIKNSNGTRLVSKSCENSCTFLTRQQKRVYYY